LRDFPPGTGITPAGEQGTSNRTFLVRHGQQRYVLRVSGFLSMAEVRAEHRILRRLRQGGLPLQVPEPVAAPDGRTVIAEVTAQADKLAVATRWAQADGGELRRSRTLTAGASRAGRGDRTPWRMCAQTASARRGPREHPSRSRQKPPAGRLRQNGSDPIADERPQP
jgi:hypothetical protein